jgi:hypothetical protein
MSGVERGAGAGARWVRLLVDGAGSGARSVRLLRAIGSERPRPRVRVDLGPSVPVWALRILQALVGVGCTALVASTDVQWFFTVLALAAGLVWPAPLWLALLPLSWGFGLAILPFGGVSVPMLLLLFGLHLYVVLGGAAAPTPASARVEWAALAPAALRFLVLQAAAQALAWGAGTLRTLDLAAPWVSILAAAVLGAVAWAAAGRLLGAPEEESDEGGAARRRASREDREPNRGDDGWSYHLDA